MARYDASREKACTASLPQAPYDSATRGIHVQILFIFRLHFLLHCACGDNCIFMHASIQVKTSEIEKYGLVWNCELRNSVSLTKC